MFCTTCLSYVIPHPHFLSIAMPLLEYFLKHIPVRWVILWPPPGNCHPQEVIRGGVVRGFCPTAVVNPETVGWQLLGGRGRSFLTRRWTGAIPSSPSMSPTIRTAPASASPAAPLHAARDRHRPPPRRDLQPRVPRPSAPWSSRPLTH